MISKIKGLLIAALVIFGSAAYAGNDVPNRPSHTGNAKLDSFVQSSFDLYKKNESIFKSIDDIGILSAALITDPVGFGVETGSSSVADAVSVAKSKPKKEFANWPSLLSGRSVSDVAKDLDADSRDVFLSRFKSIGNTYDLNHISDTGNIADEAQTLLGSANALVRDAPKNPFKVKKYLAALNAAKTVLTKMAVDYPEKASALSGFIGL